MTQIIRHLLEGPGNEPGAVGSARKQAKEFLAREGLPTRRKEGWRYMDLSWLAEGDARLGRPEKAPALSESGIQPLLDEAADRIVFQGGRYMAELSSVTQDGLNVIGLGEALSSDDQSAATLLAPGAENDGLAALNAAVAAEGAVIRIGEGKQPVRLEIHFIGSAGDGASLLRTGIELAPGSRAQIVERFYGGGESWTDLSAVLDLGDGAELSLARIVEAGAGAVRTARNFSRLAAGARLTGLIAVGGGQANREEFHISLDGEGAAADLRGFAFPSGKSVADIVTRIDHRVPDCKSDQNFRAVAGAGARAAFQGAIHVAKDAQRTDARQKFDGLLLDRKAEIDAKPELLIYADDVVCAHGATIGELDADALFYLASRGLTPGEARDLLTAAFACRIFSDVGDGPLREFLLDRLDNWLKEDGERK